MTTHFAWDKSYFVAPPTVHHICIGERPTLYCEAAKQLFGLNPTADFIWRSLVEGDRPCDVQRAFVDQGLAPDQARAFVRDAISSWLSRGELTPREVLDQLVRGGKLTRDVRICECTARVAFVGGSSSEAFDQVFGHFSNRASTPSLTISVVECGGQCFTFKENEPLGACTTEELIPRLVALLREQFISEVENAFLIHAAFLVGRNRGVLLCGPPRAGKTTLCAALVGRGYEYCSDDIVRVAPDGTAIGIPFAPAVKEGAWPIVAPYAPAITHLPIYRRADRQYVRYLPVRSSDMTPRSIDCVLLLARQPSGTAALEPVEPLEVICTILESAFSTKGRIDADALKCFARTIEAARCYRFAYSEIEEAVRYVEALMHE